MSKFIPEIIKEQSKQGLRYAGIAAGVLTASAAVFIGAHRVADEVQRTGQGAFERLDEHSPRTAEGIRKVGQGVCDIYNGIDQDGFDGRLLDLSICPPTVVTGPESFNYISGGSDTAPAQQQPGN